ARQAALELHASPISGMCEREPCGVEERTVEMRDRADVARHAAVDAAVQRVADDRMADGAEMDANLMRATGVDGDLGECQHAPEMFGAHDSRHRLPAPPEARRFGRH